jgi:tetratricopeptide (TPR) repeat protein
VESGRPARSERASRAVAFQRVRNALSVAGRDARRLRPGRPLSTALYDLCCVKRTTLLLLILFTAAACGRDALPPGSNKTPVILISIDTLRSDHLPAYGYRGVATPNIDHFRADAIRFEHAYSHVPLTLPSHATMLTGRLPADTGIRDNLGFNLDPKVATAPALLKQNGYATGAAVSSFVLHRETGINRGFDFYDDNVSIDVHSLGRSQRPGAETIRVAEQWIKPRASQPFFFFLHLYEPHAPYEPPERYRTKYPLAYDGEIAWVDELVGGFLRSLKENGVYDRALIIFVSDHGEGLGDHGEEEHGIFVYREAIQVPMLVKLPGNRMAGTSVPDPVALIDLFPTIAAQTATDVASLHLPGISLLDRGTNSGRRIYSETYYPRLYFGWSDLHSLIDGKAHFIDAPSPELYNVAADPAERRNVLPEERRLYSSMRSEIAAYEKALTPPRVDPESAKRLASLGYLGAANTASSSEKLPDPKEKLPTVRDLKTALLAFQDQDYARAESMLRPLLAANPRMPYAWNVQARSLAALGRLNEALEAAKTALALSPSATDIAIEVAEIALQLGRYDDARGHAELALHDVPSRAHELMARIALAKRDLPTARAEAGIAVQSEADRAVSFVTLGRVQREMNDYAGAITSLESAIAAARARNEEPIVNAYAWLGDSYARLDRMQEAEKAFREETALYPKNPEPYKDLILMYVAAGQPGEATRVIFDLEKTAPQPSSYVAIVGALETVGDRKGARYWAARGYRAFPKDARLSRLAAGKR